jgi:hypothetical protein
MPPAMAGYGCTGCTLPHEQISAVALTLLAVMRSSLLASLSGRACAGRVLAGPTTFRKEHVCQRHVHGTQAHSPTYHEDQVARQETQ